MKRFALIALFGIVLVSFSAAQTFEWEWSQLHLETPDNSNLLGDVDEVVQLAGESSPRFIRYEDGGIALITDNDPSPDFSWHTTFLQTELPDLGSESNTSRFFRAEGAFLRKSVWTSPTSLRSYLYNPEAGGEWVEDPDAAFENETEIYCYTAGDFNGDGRLDWAVSFMDGDEYELVVQVHFRSDDGWNSGEERLDPGYGTLILLSMYALDGDGDGLDELYLKMGNAPMHSGVYYTHVRFTRFTQEEVEFAPLRDTAEFFRGDMDDDGEPELLAYYAGALVSGELILDDLRYSFRGDIAWSPPHSPAVPLDVDDQMIPLQLISCTTTPNMEHGYPEGGPGSNPYAQYALWNHEAGSSQWTLISGRSFALVRGTALYRDILINGQSTPAIFISSHRTDETWLHTFRMDVFALPSADGTTGWTYVDSLSEFASFFEEVPFMMGYGDLTGDGELERIYLYLTNGGGNRIVEKRYDGSEWIFSRDWELPSSPVQVDAENMAVFDIDHNDSPDILFPGGHAYLSYRDSEGNIRWEYAQPFAELESPGSTAWLPAGIYDVNGNGIQDLIYSDGWVLFNSSYNSVGETSDPLPSSFHLFPATPNPFNPTTTITLQVPRAGKLHVLVFDILGREVSMLANQPTAPGMKSLIFDGKGLASGTYLVRADLDGDQTQMRKIVLIK